MPGYNSGQSPDPGDGGDYYCDANHGNNIWCPEYDNFEGNKYTMASTLHTCNYVPPNYYDWCDGGGCQTNAFNVNSNMMCPEGKIHFQNEKLVTSHLFQLKIVSHISIILDRCTINTNKPFTISHTQSNKGADGTMDSVNNWFSQEGRTANFNVCSDPNYVKNMG